LRTEIFYMKEILEQVKGWLSDTFDSETRTEIQQLIDSNSEDLVDRFYKNMEFGTGGMRGIMGAGTNRINKYTLGKATQGLSNYLHKSFPKKDLKVAIAFDCRHNSKEFSKLVADVLSANNIQVYLFEDLRPTPELSFAVNYLNCDAGIVLTASHNPPEYNGYKVYWNDGGQIVPPQDKSIIDEVNSLEFSDINFNAKPALISEIGAEVDEAFWKASIKNGTFDIQGRENLKIVFTSLHGTSVKLIPEVLKRAGYSQVHSIKEQEIPNGDFPTVKSPNPEEPEALEMATNLAEKIGADIVLGTDPDSDRIGINTINAYKRALNIIQNIDSEIEGRPDPVLFRKDEEKVLFEKINDIRKAFTVKEDKKNYENLLIQMSEIKPLTDNFFDNVKVNDENNDIKNNRLELLKMFCNTFNNFINFSKLEGL